MEQYDFAPSNHITNIRNLKRIHITIKYNDFIEALKIYYKQNNLANFEKNKHKVYK